MRGLLIALSLCLLLCPATGEAQDTVLPDLPTVYDPYAPPPPFVQPWEDGAWVWTDDMICPEEVQRLSDRGGQQFWWESDYGSEIVFSFWNPDEYYTETLTAGGPFAGCRELLAEYRACLSRCDRDYQEDVQRAMQRLAYSATVCGGTAWKGGGDWRKMALTYIWCLTAASAQNTYQDYYARLAKLQRCRMNCKPIQCIGPGE